MPKFPKNTGFKLPGIGSREIDTPGNFRKSQKVEDVGYCLNTEPNMLPKGSSPLLATESDLHDTSWLVPKADKPSYTGSRSTKPWPTKKKDKTPPEVETTKESDLKPCGEGFEEGVGGVCVPIEEEVEDRDTMIIQQPGEERRGVTNFAPGTDVDKAKQYISEYKAKILEANPDFTPDQVTQKYRADHNIGEVTTTPGQTIEFSGIDLKKKIL